MSVEPSAKEVFELLSQGGSPKFVKTLERIRTACDHIEAAKGPMTYSQVGAVATKLFGGPKAQSIHNNPDHKRYIDARHQAYRQQPTGNATGHTEAKPSLKYPATGLDLKTRRYIDDLRQRNEMLEAAMREFRGQISRATQENPIDLASLIADGPDQAGALALPAPLVRQGVPEVALVGLRTLLFELPKLLAEVECFHGKALRLRSGDWLVPPDQYAALVSLLGENSAIDANDGARSATQAKV